MTNKVLIDIHTAVEDLTLGNNKLAYKRLNKILNNKDIVFELPYSEIDFVEVIVYIEQDYSKNKTIKVRRDLSKDEITTIVKDNFKEWYYYDIM